MLAHPPHRPVDNGAVAEPPAEAERRSDLAREIEARTDVIAARLARSVMIETLEHAVAAYNCEAGALDDAQAATILHRAVPDPLRRHLRYADFNTSERPTRVPAAVGLGLRSRLCVTLRHHCDPVGYLWIADPDETLSPEALADVAAVVAGIGPLLHQKNSRRRDAWQRRRDALHGYVAELPDPSEETLRALHEHRVTSDRGPLSCLALGSGGATHHAAEELEALCVRERVNRATVAVGSEYVFVTVAGENALDHPLLRRVAGAMCDMLAAEQGCRSVAGLSSAEAGPAPEITAAAQRAIWAYRVALALPEFGVVTNWDDLGIYRVIEGASRAQPAEVVPPALLALLEDPSRSELVDTLERYLDSGGDIKLTAAELSLHRTSLYYRLQRIEEMTGMSVRNGGERLALHLGLKLARVLGSHPGAPASAARAA